METPNWFAKLGLKLDYEEYLGHAAWYSFFVIKHGRPPERQAWETLDGREKVAWQAAALAAYGICVFDRLAQDSTWKLAEEP